MAGNLPFSGAMKKAISSAGAFVFCAVAFTIAPASAQWQRKLVGPTSLAFSLDGKTLATGNIEDYLAPGDLRLWRVADGKLLHKTRYVYGVNGVAFSPDGKTLAMTTMVEKSKNPIRLWDVAAWRTRQVLGDDQFLSSIDYAPDSRRLIVGSDMGENGNSDYAYVWNIRKNRNRVLPESGGFSQMLWSSSGTILGAFLFDDYKNSLRAWNAKGGLLWKLSQPNLNNAALMPDNHTFLAAIGERNSNETAHAGAVQVREIANGKVKYSLKQSVPALAVAAASNGNMWASAGTDGTVRFWNATTRRVFSTLKLHKGDVHALKFSPDNHFVASICYDDDSVRLTRVPPLR